MRLCLPARMGGGGKAESLPWSGPAGEARHTGATILLWEKRGQSPWRSNLSNKRSRSGSGAFRKRRRSASLSRHAAKQRHPCTERRQPDALRPDLWASGRPPRREARAPAGQLKNTAPSRSEAGKSAAPEKSRSFSHAPDRHAKRQYYKLGSCNEKKNSLLSALIYQSPKSQVILDKIQQTRFRGIYLNTPD